MNTHVSKRLFVAAAVVGALAVFAAAFFVALGIRSVVAGPGASPGGPVPNPGHQWTELQDHGIDGGDYWLGTIDMQALELRVYGERALRLEPTTDTPNLIGGYSGNSVTDGAYGATIGGGGGIGSANRVTDAFGTVGGGIDNLAGDDAGSTEDAYHPTVAGGGYNAASARNATVGGGYHNEASGLACTIAGGEFNTANNEYATIAGGESNTASGHQATVGGGHDNTASGHQATIGGGDTNNVSGAEATVGGGAYCTASGQNATVSGGRDNTADNEFATVGGGFTNTASGDTATVAGGADNTASGLVATVGGGLGNAASASYATIAGGGRTDPGDLATGNRVTDDYGTIGGGGNNQAGNADPDSANTPYATVGGGQNNIASDYAATVSGGAGSSASGEHATVGGGAGNTASGWSATVGGGEGNTASASHATVGGGDTNSASGTNATVAGGDDNTASAHEATVGGGGSNTASGIYATVGGGVNNTASGSHATVGGGNHNLASGPAATVSGGQNNTASGWGGTVPGGEQNTAAGELSFAAGYRAKADHNGSFVFADLNEFDFGSAGGNEFAVRATGDARFVLDIDPITGAPTWICSVSSGGTWSCSSDRSLKENLTAADGGEILERLSDVPVLTWNAKSQDPAVRHIGPMAEDFYAAFGVGEDDGQIATIDLDGVALAAIQGLYELSQEQADRIQALETENDDLEARVAALEGEAGVSGGSAGLLSSIMPAGWLLLGGLFLGGLVLVQRRRAGGER